MSIFIAMPTTQDTEFLPTIQDAIEKADDPKGLYFGIRMMTSNESDKDYFNKLQMQYGSQIRGHWIFNIASAYLGLAANFIVSVLLDAPRVSLSSSVSFVCVCWLSRHWTQICCSR